MLTSVSCFMSDVSWNDGRHEKSFMTHNTGLMKHDTIRGFCALKIGNQKTNLAHLGFRYPMGPAQLPLALGRLAPQKVTPARTKDQNLSRPCHLYPILNPFDCLELRHSITLWVLPRHFSHLDRKHDQRQGWKRNRPLYGRPSLETAPQRAGCLSSPSPEPSCALPPPWPTIA